MTYKITPFSSKGFSPVEDALTATRTPGEPNTYFHSYNAALVPAPLFANKPQALLTGAKSAPTNRNSEDLSHGSRRSYTVNTATTRANNITVNTNHHSRSLIDDFIKALADGLKTPRNLIDNFLNGLAQGSQPNRRTPRKCHVPKPTVESRASIDMHSVADTSTEISSTLTPSSSIFTHLTEPLKCAPASMPIEATISAMIEELSSTTETCSTPSSVVRNPNNIPRRRLASDDLRVEYKKACLETISDEAFFAGKPTSTCARPLSSINTNVKTLEHASLPELKQGSRPSPPQAERPRLSVNTNVNACYSNSSLELKAGRHARAFYTALINGEIDASACIAVGIASPVDDVAETIELEMVSSAASKTSLELEYEKHEESFYMGLINGDSDSETSSRYSLSARFAGTFLDSPVSPLSATGFLVRSGAPSPSSSLSESTALVIRVHTPLDAISAPEKEEHSATQDLPTGEEQGSRNLFGMATCVESDAHSCNDGELQSLHRFIGSTCEPLPESQRASELSTNISELRLQECLDSTEVTRPCWNIQRAQSRRIRRTVSRQSSMQMSPFFHASL